VRRIAITDNAAVNAGKRLAGSWDLRDEKWNFLSLPPSNVTP
jgi:hypothetical protein